MKNWLVIIGMMLVTYIPRLIPLVTLADRPLPPIFKRFLLYIPFTALGALIIPGVVQATPGKPVAALAGISAAAVCAWFKGGIIFSVLISILVTFLALCFWNESF